MVVLAGPGQLFSSVQTEFSGAMTAHPCVFECHPLWWPAFRLHGFVRDSPFIGDGQMKILEIM